MNEPKDSQPVPIKSCPSCGSENPKHHPATSAGGEVSLCHNKWHSPTAEEIRAKERLDSQPVSSQELEEVIAGYLDNFQCDGADGEDSPVTDEQRKFARGVIDGLLGDSEWDELWGRIIRQRVRELIDSQPVPVEPVLRYELRGKEMVACESTITGLPCGDWVTVEAYEALQSELQRVTEERDTAKKNYQFMVERAADEKLDGYRELGDKCASLEIRAESAESQLAKVTEEQEIGRRWKATSSLEEWFPYTAEELKRVTEERDTQGRYATEMLDALKGEQVARAAAESRNNRLVELLRRMRTELGYCDMQLKGEGYTTGPDLRAAIRDADELLKDVGNYTPKPDPLSQALNEGDGVYRP